MKEFGETEPITPAAETHKRKHKADWAGEREGSKHRFVLELVSRGFQYREAGQVIDAIFASMKEALLRHESVELPFGTLRVVRNPEPRRTFNFGKLTILYKRRYGVIFEASHRAASSASSD